MGGVAGAILITQAACGSGVAPDTGDLTTVEIDPGSVEVEVQSTVELEARLMDDGGNEIGGRTVHWSVEDPDVAQISSDGVVTGRSVGSTRVAASVDGVDAVAEVEVLPRAVISIEVAPGEIDLVEGQTMDLSAIALDRRDRKFDGLGFEWSSTNTKVAKVDEDGRVTAVRKGSAKIRASAGGKMGEAVVKVAARPVDRVEIAPASATLKTGETRRFEAVARASNGSKLDGRDASWSSTDTDVVTIGSDGVARAVEPGSARIEARIEGRVARADVTVERRSVDRIEISPSSANLKVGDTRRFTAKLEADDGSTLRDRDIAWSSSRPAVATVDDNGRVTARFPGETTITVTSEGKRATAEVRVRSRFGRGNGGDHDDDDDEDEDDDD